jgi:hypothetical protein
MGEKGVQEVLYSLHPFLSSIFTYVVHMAKHKAPLSGNSFINGADYVVCV